MNKKVLHFAMLLLAMLIAMPTTADAAKEKKEKKPYEWNWDKQLSGNEIVDDYLMSVDSIWYQMKELNTVMEAYTYKEDTIVVNGKTYIAAHMEDSEGNYVTRGTVNWQFAQTTMLSGEIVLKAATVGLQTASATMSLPNLGLKALSYGKYVKAGPKVIGMAATGVKNIWHVAVAQAKRWNGMKAETVDPTTIGLELTDKQKELFDKCIYIKEVKETSPEYQVVKDVVSAKSEEQLKSESDAYFSALANANILPEEAGKTLDNLSDDELEKYANA